MVQRLCVFPEYWSLAAMMVGFKLPPLGLSIAQVGFSSLEGFFTTLSRLIRLHSSPSTSLPLCAPNSFGESLASFIYVMIFSDYLLCRSLVKNRLKYKYLLLLVVLS